METDTTPQQHRARATGPVPAFYDPRTYRPEESVGYLMRQILDRVADAVEDELEPEGLTNSQWLPLVKMLMGSNMTVAELARQCRLDVGGMTRMLDRLEAKGLVRRERSQTDRRVVNLALTPEGRERAQKIPAVLCGVQNNHLRGFSKDEWELLRGLLRRILDNAVQIRAERDQAAQGQER
ncbi:MULTISPECIES: MarR family transcriptional regulator [Ramlibacter]|uniref:MarR family transcriptional regulator n=1 Tax=Ramlibacter aquaticus TaxID=2780094 RepID=A0ABR9SEF8_9BURK|nr:MULTISPECIES: MarR family transcriptional regulator [Ramlibacter]MBE7940748.1 MarR family transcriptional regulator [Ramlibacter aquaticus]